MKDLIKEYGEFFTLKYWDYILLTLVFTIIYKYASYYIFIIVVALSILLVIFDSYVLKPKRNLKPKKKKDTRRDFPFRITLVFTIFFSVIINMIEKYLLR